VGDTRVEGALDSDPAGEAEAFQYTATAGGSANNLYVYVDATNRASSIVVGVYSDNASNPGTLLTQGTISAPRNGAWNSVAVSPVSLTRGDKYWIAVLSPIGSGTVIYRDVSAGGLAQSHSVTNLTTLPATWSPGANWANAPMSAYAVQAP
jgi:hypothetical protein